MQKKVDQIDRLPFGHLIAGKIVNTEPTRELINVALVVTSEPNGTNNGTND